MDYFGSRRARDALASGVVFAALVAIFDGALVAVHVPDALASAAQARPTWLPWLLIFFATWITGSVTAMAPRPEHPRSSRKLR